VNDHSGAVKRSPAIADYRERNGSVDRRAVFLLGAAVICVLLVPLAPEDLSYVGVVLAIWCVVLAVASWLDHLSRRNR
jgi:hypothetical protein